MAKNWLILDNGMDGTGIPVNLDNVTAIVCGAQMKQAGIAPTGRNESIFIHHADGSATSILFESAALAVAAYDRLIANLSGLGFVGADLRQQSGQLAGPATGARGVPITVTGTDFVSISGAVTIGGLPATVVSGGAGSITVLPDPSLAPGVYDLVYTDANGNAAVIDGGITIT